MIKNIAIIGVVVVCLLAAWIHSEQKRAEAVNPATGATNFVAFLAARPQFTEIRKFTFNEKAHLEIIGRPYISALSVPSGPPVYIFNESGALVDWCRDIGDQPSFVAKWGGFSNATPVSVEEAKQLVKAHN